MKTYRHSGTLGDLIYSLSIVKKMEPGKFLVALNNIENCVSKYGYRAEDVDPQHKGRFTVRDYEMLRPLLQRQAYITQVGTWSRGMIEPDIDLDHYRSVLYRTFEGNILEAYHRTFNIPFAQEDYNTPWLTADTITTKPIVISRSRRYRPPNGDAAWQNMLEDFDLESNAVFVGTPTEHEDFVNQFDVKGLEYRPVQDFLELASIINGAELYAGNQGFAYSLATGLGKSTILEINKIVPQHMNECYFPRPNAQYF